MEQSSSPTNHGSGAGRGISVLVEQRKTREAVIQAVSALARGEAVIVVGDRHSGFAGALVAAAIGSPPKR